VRPPAPRLVGRELELERLHAILDGLRSGGAPVTELVGEPGIGKTRLLAELIARAEDRRYLAFSGQGAEFENRIPFGLFVDALEPYLASQNPRRFGSLDAEQLGELAVLFPSLGELAVGASAPMQHERYRAHRAVRSLIALLCSERPCVLGLDDVHWADQASLELLAHLLRRGPPGRAWILLAFRPAQAPELLRVALARAEREGTAERIGLTPLTRRDAETLLDPGLGEAMRDELYRRSGGNPFYLEQLARVVGRGGGVPRGVAESIAEEIRRLDDPVRLVLRGAAVAGDPFSPDVCAAAAGVEPGSALAALDQLLAVDLLRPAPSPVEFRFRHPIVRAAAYEGTPPAWRLGAHARAAGKLAELGMPVTLQAHHVERSAQPGDRHAISLLAAAGNATAARAPAAAATWFAGALRLLPPDADSGERLGLLAPLARSLGAAGQLEASGDALAEVLELLPSGLGLIRSQTIAFMALIQRLLGRHGQARETLEAALGDLPDTSSPEALSLEVELGADAFLLGEWQRAHECARRALTLARDGDNRAIHAAAAALVALCSYQQGDAGDARARTAEAAEIVDELADQEVALRLDGCFSLGAAEMLLEQYDSSARHLERCIAVSRHTGQGHMLGPATIDLAILRIWQGRLTDASALAEEALELAYLAHSDQVMEWAQTVACWTALKRGELDAAITAGEEAVRIGREVRRGAYTVGAACWLADAMVESGNPSGARRVLLESIQPATLEGVDRGYRTVACDVLARAELAVGNLDAARRWADESSAEAAAIELRRPDSLALRTRASVALAEGQPERAAELALAAANRGASIHRVEAAQARVIAGRSLLAAGKRERGLVELRTAYRELDECGADRYRDQAARALRRAGERVGRPGRRAGAAGGIESLSGREREVADLVADRLTNREIAGRLVLSEKTIERHLSRIFVKLNVTSRVELARLIERTGGSS
jgi:ATP/maltotriose-dependent transcriptional regulator MalT